MFFKREKDQAVTFSQRMDALRSSGYRVENGARGHVVVIRGNLAAELLEGASGAPAITGMGLWLGSEVAVLTDLGFQKIFLSPGGKKTPALAEHLHALHAFTEDLRRELGLTSLYNQGLGTTNEKHLYDRVRGRDAVQIPKPWERA
jgi:hypothetical protein